jgi:hypothetical protein
MLRQGHQAGSFMGWVDPLPQFFCQRSDVSNAHSLDVSDDRMQGLTGKTT